MVYVFLSNTNVIFSYTDSCTYIHIFAHAGYILTKWITTSKDFFRKICISHFIVRVRKGLLKVCVWEGVGDWTKTAIFWPHSYGHQRCVFLVLLMLNRRPGGSAFCWVLAFSTTSCLPQGPLRPDMAFPTTSYQQLLWTPTHQGSKGPLRRAFSTTSCLLTRLIYNSWLLVLTELYISSTPTQSLECPVWSSSSGNNSHAVHRSLSSGASVYECTMGFFCLVPFLQPNLAYATSFDYWPLGCVTSFRSITLEWYICPGRRSKYNTNNSSAILWFKVTIPVC